MKGKESPLALTVKDVAHELQVSEWQVYELIRQGQLPHVKIGRRKIVPRKALEQWLERRCKNGSDERSNPSTSAAGY
ncbi:MAG: helix-turn-helix domain-containing protein [Firmicutes bacterium]|nr:helix-turn-helix domain-containing protein [Bacillota bacterium]